MRVGAELLLVISLIACGGRMEPEPIELEASPYRGQGHVELYQEGIGSPTHSTASAHFWYSRAKRWENLAHDGACDVYQSLRPAMPSILDAGRLTVSAGGTSIALDYHNAYGTTGYYQNIFNGFWAAGDTLDVDLAGNADIPPFSLSLAAPELVALTAPNDGDEYRLGEDVDCAWPTTLSSRVVVLIAKQDPPVFVQCEWEGSVGSGVVPGALMRYLGSGGFYVVSSGVHDVTEISADGQWRLFVHSESRSSSPPFLHVIAD